MNNNWIKNRNQKQQSEFTCLSGNCVVKDLDCIFSCHMPGAKERRAAYLKKHPEYELDLLKNQNKVK